MSMFGNNGDPDPSDPNIGWIEMKDELDRDEDEIPISMSGFVHGVGEMDARSSVTRSTPSTRSPREDSAEPLMSGEQKHAAQQPASLADPLASQFRSPGDSPPRLGSPLKANSPEAQAYDEEEEKEERVIPDEGLGVDGTCIQSRDFVEHQSQLYQDKLSQMNPTTYRNIHIKRWFLTILVGIAVAIVGVLISAAIKALFKAKFSRVQGIFNDGQNFKGFFVYISINLALAVFNGVLCTYVEPAAAGSGMGDVRCGLNGMRIPRAERLRTMFARSIGVITSVASSLPAGKQGPMVHIGSSIAASISQGQTTWLNGRIDMSWTKVQAFRNDYEKRDFISCGAAAGIACAFGAPIGGVLFMLEAGSTFWHLELTWRTFLCTMIAAAISTLLGRLVLGGNRTGDMVFGDFNASEKERNLSYELYELPLFLLCGLVFGATGALFVRACAWLHPRMKKIFKNKRLRVLEVLLVSFLFSVTAFAFPLIFAEWHCEGVPKDSVVKETYVRFTCPAGKYNEAASLSFQGPEGVLKQLFHSKQNFQLYVIIPWFIVYFLWSVVVSGIAISAGQFVPLMVNGALMGRIFGQIFDSNLGIITAPPGNWALIGSAALLGGATRLTLSLAVFLIEATGDIQFGLPLMITLTGAKMISDRISLGLYDVQIRRNKWPYLDTHPHPAAQYMQAGKVMNTKIPTLRQVCEVGAILDVLSDPHVNCICIVMEPVKDTRLPNVTVASSESGGQQTSPIGNASATMHSVFHTTKTPFSTDLEGNDIGIDVYEPEWMVHKEGRPTDKRFCGIILRKHLQCILHARAWTKHRPLAGSERPKLTWDDIEKFYPHYPAFEDVEVSQAERLCWVDLTPYMHRSPHTAFVFSPLVQVFKLFREMGLRHLPVLNGANDLVGLITRKSLTWAYVEAVDAKRGKAAWKNRKPRKMRRKNKQKNANKKEPGSNQVQPSPVDIDQELAALGDTEAGKRLAMRSIRGELNYVSQDPNNMVR